MKITIDQPILNIADDNKAIKNGEEDLTLKKVMQIAVLSSGEKLSLDENLKRYSIGQKLSAAKKEVELTAEEITAVKKAIADSYGIAIVGYSCELIEAASNKK